MKRSQSCTDLKVLHRRLLLQSCMEAALHLGIPLLQALAKCSELAVLVDEISQVSLHDRIAGGQCQPLMVEHLSTDKISEGHIHHAALHLGSQLPIFDQLLMFQADERRPAKQA